MVLTSARAASPLSSFGRLRNGSRPSDSQTSSRPSVSGTALVLQKPEQLSSYGLRNSSRLSKSRTALVLRTPETALVLRTPERLSSFGLQYSSRPSESRTALVLRTPEQLSSFGLQYSSRPSDSSTFRNSSRPQDSGTACRGHTREGASIITRRWLQNRSKCINRYSLPSFYIHLLLGTGAQDGHLDFHTAPDLCVCVVVDRFYIAFTSSS